MGTIEGHDDFEYAIETLTIEIARLQTAIREQEAMPQDPEHYGRSVREGNFERRIKELKKAVELLMKAT